MYVFHMHDHDEEEQEVRIMNHDDADRSAAARSFGQQWHCTMNRDKSSED